MFSKFYVNMFQVQSTKQECAKLSEKLTMVLKSPPALTQEPNKNWSEEEVKLVVEGN